MYQSDLTPREAKIAVTAILIYVSIYALEAPLRYGLASIRLIEIILLRDFLITGPLAYIGIRQALNGRLNPVLLVFVFLVAIQGAVFYLNFHVIGPIVLGSKLLLNIALGLIVGSALINTTGRPIKVLTILFFVTCIGLFVEKFVMRYPWVGMSTMIGGIDVPISTDWQVDDDIGRRVGGFTRISINAASLVPFLAFILIPKIPSVWRRLPMLLLAIGSVFLTTQKGALVAVLLVSCALLVTGVLRSTALRLIVLSGGAAQIILPFATAGMSMSEGTGGVFSASSFAARVLYTWPGAIRYLNDHTIGIFGMGIGSMGGPVRLFMAATVEMFADNMFLILYAYLGIFAAFFYWSVIYAVWRSLGVARHVTNAALALLGFALWYGVVITGIEDQMVSLSIGLSLGCLLTAPYASVAVPRPMPSRPMKPRLGASQQA